MTPAQWELRGNEIDDDGHVFHTIFGEIGHRHFNGKAVALTDDVGDGRLLASAPKLLAALEQNIHYLPPCDETTAIKKLMSWILTGTVPE